MVKQLKITLEAGKTAIIRNPKEKDFNIVTITVYFVEINKLAQVPLDVKAIRAYLQAHPAKTLKDYAIQLLLPFYNMYADTRAIRKAIEKLLK